MGGFIDRDVFRKALVDIPLRFRSQTISFMTEALLRANDWTGPSPYSRDLEVMDRGQFVMGRDEMAAAIGASVQTLRTVAKYLIRTNRIRIEATSRGTIVTVIDFDSYCPNLNQSNQDDLGEGNQEDVAAIEDQVIELSQTFTPGDDLDHAKAMDIINDLCTKVGFFGRDGKPPYSLFSRMFQVYGYWIPISFMRRCYGSGMCPPSASYVVAACEGYKKKELERNKVNERQVNAQANRSQDWRKALNGE